MRDDHPLDGEVTERVEGREQALGGCRPAAVSAGIVG
jgi:hypothetical protein